MENFIAEIIKNQQTCIFISPHLDDAMLSAGGLISRLSQKTPVIILNVFTQALDDKPTISAWKYVHAMGHTKATTLYALRRKEDTDAFAHLGIVPINLGFIEALWRKKTGKIANLLGKYIPECSYMYPIYRLHINSGKIAHADKQSMNALSQQIKHVVQQEKKPLIFSPFGIGNHVDHIVVKKVCEALFEKKCIYWSDFPYNVRVRKFGIAPVGYKKVSLQYDTHKKNKLISYYKTQTMGLFGGAEIPNHQEVFFIPEN